jgi:hypothetical protein
MLDSCRSSLAGRGREATHGPRRSLTGHYRKFEESECQPDSGRSSDEKRITVFGRRNGYFAMEIVSAFEFG